MSPLTMRRTLTTRARGALLVFGAALIAFSAAGQVLAQELETIEPGKLIVGFNGDMPMTSLKDGVLIGSDGKMIAKIAADLGLEVVPSQADWAAVIEATTSGRNDVMLGAMGWTEERSKVMTISDPIYYFGTLLAQKSSTNYSTFADMAGKKVGTVTGFTLVPELKAVPGIGEALSLRRESVIAVSPIVGGAALKGPAARLMTNLGEEASVVGVARRYAPFASALIIDTVDADLAGAVAQAGMTPVVAPSIMDTPERAAELARVCLAGAPR